MAWRNIRLELGLCCIWSVAADPCEFSSSTQESSHFSHTCCRFGIVCPLPLPTAYCDTMFPKGALVMLSRAVERLLGRSDDKGITWGVGRVW